MDPINFHAITEISLFWTLLHKDSYLTNFDQLLSIPYVCLILIK